MEQDKKPSLKVERARRRAYEAPAQDEAPPSREGPAGKGWPPAPPRPLPEEEEARERRAMELMRRWALGAAGVGLAPVPLLDLAGITALQVLLVRDLARLFDVPFRPQRCRALLAGLSGGLASLGLAGGLSFLKALPVAGAALSAAALPALAGAATYGVGRVFLLHFQTGGTLLDFDPKAMGEYFREGVREGKKFMKRDRA